MIVRFVQRWRVGKDLLLLHWSLHLVLPTPESLSHADCPHRGEDNSRHNGSSCVNIFSTLVNCIFSSSFKYRVSRYVQTPLLASLPCLSFSSLYPVVSIITCFRDETAQHVKLIQSSYLLFHLNKARFAASRHVKLCSYHMPLYFLLSSRHLRI